MRCTSCHAPLPDDARFCGHCGTPVPQVDPASVEAYRELLAELGPTAPELAAIRAELGVPLAVHERLAAELAPADVLGLTAWFDQSTVADFRVGSRCLLRLRFHNVATTTVRKGTVAWRCGEAGGDVPLGLITAGGEAVVAWAWVPDAPGHHELRATVSTVGLRGDAHHRALGPVHLKVADRGALQQTITIDASSQRVGVFENIGGAESGGMVGQAAWHPVALTALAEAPSPTPDAPRGEVPVGHRGTARVVAVDGAGVWAELSGPAGGVVKGRIVQLDDPGMLAVLSPGDQLTVSLLAHPPDGEALLGTGAWAAPTPHAPVVDGHDLGDALARAPAGATVRIPAGTHTGPFVVSRRVELVADDGAVLVGARGAVLTVRADAVLRGLTVRSGSPGGYAPDGVVVTSGSVRLDDCDIDVSTPDAMTPGRALALTGPCRVQMDGGRLAGGGVGAAVDTSWGGFPETTARGAELVLGRVVLSGNDIALAVSGDGRRARATDCRCDGHRVGVLAQGGAEVVAHPMPTPVQCDPSSRTRSAP